MKFLLSPSLGLVMMVVLPFISTISLALLPFSLLLNGLTRTATLRFSSSPFLEEDPPDEEPPPLLLRLSLPISSWPLLLVSLLLLRRHARFQSRHTRSFVEWTKEFTLANYT